MVMVGHSQRLAQPLTRQQKRAIALVVVVLAADTMWVVLRSSPEPTSSAGCVNLVVASSTGGSALHECGAAARSWCRSEFTRDDALALRVQAQCRLAGLRPRGG
jgi:hypothetical protein